MKLAFKKTLPVDSCTAEIQAVLLNQRIQKELEESSKGVSADFNLKYLDLADPTELFPPSLAGPMANRFNLKPSLRLQPTQQP